MYASSSYQPNRNCWVFICSLHQPLIPGLCKFLIRTMSMAEKNSELLHVLFLPYLTPSHMIPLVDAARLFAANGVKVTIITTPYNEALFRSSIDHDVGLSRQITVCTIPFPAAEVGLPEGIENFSAITSGEMMGKLSQGISLLQKPMEKLILDISPHCIFSDISFPWTVDVAEKLKVPRLLFYPTNLIFHCIQYNLEQYAPHEKVKSDSENFLIPCLPDKIQMKRSQLEDYLLGSSTTGLREMIRECKESELRSYGMVHDCVYELEPAYVDYYQKVKGKKCWTIGPLFHFSNRAKANSTDPDVAHCRHSCLNWLNSQEPNSILFISFGSLASFTSAQLKEIALALDATNQPFIWVVRKRGKTGEDEQETSWLLNGFEERMTKNNKGLIIRNWAPQLMILSHSAVGGFMTHCGWNSTQEGITAGVPLITWPLSAEQFYNEKLIEILKIGVSIGADVWKHIMDSSTPLLGKKQIEEAIKRLMCKSEESEKIRQRAKGVAAMVRRATEEDGSSHQNLRDLIEGIKSQAFGTKN